MSIDHGPITVVLAADNFLIGDGLAALLGESGDVKVVGRAQQHDELVELVDELAPEAVIISIRTPIITAMAMIEVARRLRADHAEMGIVVISDRGNGFALELLRGGASRLAYLLDKRLPSIDAVLGALREVRAGQTVLDPSIVDSLVTRREGVAIDDLSLRELDVLELIADGLSNRTIATTLNLSIKAVEKHVTDIFRKLELADQSLVDRRVTAALTYQHAQTSPLVLRHQGPPEGRDVFRPRG